MTKDKLQVVVFGAGDIAVEVMVRLPTHYQVVALADNDPAKQGRLVMGLPVLAADTLVDVSCDAIFIALVSRHHSAVKTQLAALGLLSKVTELLPEVSLAAIEAAQAPDRSVIYNPYASAAGQHHLKQVRDFQQQHAEQAPYPNVFFINMTCSGGSAIDPVLRSILASRWYFLPPFGPEGSSLIDFFPHQPFYHWSHSCVSQFSQYLHRPDCKFIFMHRDPRDTAVSIANDYFGRLLEPAFPAMLQLTVSCYLKPPVTIALEWLRQQCLVITFDEMKASTPAVIRRILNHCGIDDVTDEEIEQHAAAHSFERMTGRQRGEEGNAIRTGYFWRKGVSGDWRNHFDPRLTDEFKYLYGDALVTLGYETDLDW